MCRLAWRVIAEEDSRGLFNFFEDLSECGLVLDGGLCLLLGINDDLAGAGFAYPFTRHLFDGRDRAKSLLLFRLCHSQEFSAVVFRSQARPVE
jgi:hypothetical protein